MQPPTHRRISWRGTIPFLLCGLIGASLFDSPGAATRGQGKFIVEKIGANSVTVQVMHPGAFTVPAHLRTIGLVRRYRPETGGGSKLLKKLEGLLTHEEYGQDLSGVDAAIAGLTLALAGSPRFQVVHVPEEPPGSGRSYFPDPLPPTEVQRLCTQYRADGLVALEVFDSDTKTRTDAQTQTRKTSGGATESYVIHKATRRVNAKIGWRIYDGVDGHVIDQFAESDDAQGQAEGDDEDSAQKKLPDGKELVVQVGQKAGAAFARRIAPAWYPEERAYFRRGNPQLKAASKKLRTGDWVSALAIWNQLAAAGKSETRGRAAYNVALALEVYGDLDAAITWASVASNEHGNKRAAGYLNTLRTRAAEAIVIEAQLAAPTD